MILTDDQYEGLYKLEKWYWKHTHQIIEISCVIGTGVEQLINYFIERSNLDIKEVMFLSYDQKQVLEMAAKRYHAYYVNSIIYKYFREVDFDTLPVINQHSNQIEYKWKKEVRNKIDPRYKLIIVFDSMLLNEKTLSDLGSFGLPIILIKDPMLFPAPDSFTYTRDANIVLREIHPELYKNPIIYFANKILRGEKIQFGNYDNVSIIHRKEMNLYNLKSPNMVLTLSDEMRNQVNKIYRSRILKQRSIINVPGERLICMSNMYAHKLVNSNEKKVKVFLTKGIVGKITKCNKHVVSTKYLPIVFQPEFYYDQFDDLTIDRHYLNKIDVPSRQIIPDEVAYFDYAYALTPQMARINHWDKVTLIVDRDELDDENIMKYKLYTAITRARRQMTIII